MKDHRELFWTIFAAVLTALVLGLGFYTALQLAITNAQGLGFAGLIAMLLILLVTGAAISRAL